MLSDQELQQIRARCDALTDAVARNFPAADEMALYRLQDHAHRDLQDLLAEVRRLRAERRWIPVEERLPEHDGHVLILASDQHGVWQANISAYTHVGFGGQMLPDRAWMEPYECFSRHSTITHWMPLPPPHGTEQAARAAEKESAHE